MKWMQFLTPARSIDYHETRSMINVEGGEGVTVLDVRQPGEYKTSHIPGAVLIPLPELSDRFQEIDTEKPVVVY